MNKQISIYLILIISLFSFTGCTETASDGTIRQVGLAQKVGSYLYNPVYEDTVVGQEIIETVDEATGEVLSTETVDVIEKVLVRYEPNAVGKMLIAGADLIPLPGAGTATTGLLGAGSIALLALERLRRKEKKGKVSVQDKFEVLVGGIKEFAKTEEGAKAKEMLYEKLSDKAQEHGISKEFKTAVKVAKAIL